MASIAIPEPNAAAVLSRKLGEIALTGATMSRQALLTRQDVIMAASNSMEPANEIVIKFDEDRAAGPIPAWVLPTAEAFAGVLELPPGWNSYNARAVDPRTIESAGRLLASVMEESTPPPAVVPTVRGGVQLEWHRNGLDIEIAINPSLPIAVYAVDNRTGEECESEWPSGGIDLSPWIRQL
jgi:hypothetical protein